MKKSLIIFFISTAAMFLLCFSIGKTVVADEVEEAGKVYFHYQLWDEDYSSAGLWTWDNGEGGSVDAVTSETVDDFGAVYEITVMPDANDKIGIIPIRKDITLDSRWDYRETPDGYHIEFDVTPLLNGDKEAIHVYYFQGGYRNYYVLDETKANVLLLYYAPSYEVNLGVHAWDGWTNFEETGWGTPAEVFTDGFKSPGNAQGKAAMLQFEPESTPGLLIYAGDDASKKHAGYGDIKDFSLAAGEMEVIYVSGGNIYRGLEAMSDFVESAFEFGFIPFLAGELDGTFAKDSRTIYVKTTVPLGIKEVIDQETYIVEEVVGRRVIVEDSEDGWKLPDDLPEFDDYVPEQVPGDLAGKVVFHYQKWSGDYTGIGLWTWGTGDGGTSEGVAMAGVDEFGAVMEIMIAEDAEDTIGIVPIASEIDNDSRWDYRETPDGEHIELDVTLIKDGLAEELHIYYFQGGHNNYYKIAADKANIIVVYYDRAEEYEDNLGIHAWGGWTNFEETGWGTPAQVFTDGFKSPDDLIGKAALLQYDPEDSPGMLIYAGDDETKKHDGDISFDDIGTGEVKVVYVTVGEIYDSRLEFAPVAFGGSIRFEDIIEEVEKVRDVMGTIDMMPYFTLKQGETEIPIEMISFSDSADECNEFVIILSEDNELDNQKEYILYFDGYEHGDETYSGDIVLDLDTEAPVIEIPDNTGEDIYVIEITAGEDWDHTNWPIIRASDNRDGNLSSLVYVVEGHGLLDTRKPGTYNILVRVEDEWGNVGELEFQFNVVKPSGCAKKSTEMFVSFGLLGLVFLFRRRRRLV